MDLRWEDPAPRQTRTKYDEIHEQLKANPGRWALIKEFTDDGSHLSSPSNRAGGTKQYLLRKAALPNTEVEVRGGKVYARYVGTS